MANRRDLPPRKRSQETIHSRAQTVHGRGETPERYPGTDVEVRGSRVERVDQSGEVGIDGDGGGRWGDTSSGGL